MKPKFGIIGCGNISKFHFRGLQKAGADLVHIADQNEAAARPYIDRFGARYSADYRSVIADPEVTVVSVLTNAKSHKDICIAALRAGKDVICEKTMTNSAREAYEVVEAAKTSGQIFFTAYMKRFFPAVLKAKALMPQLGRLFSANVRAYQCANNLYELEQGSDYSHVVDGYGGVIVKTAGSHMIDMTLHLVGRPDSLYAKVDYIADSDVDRKATALFEYNNGLVVSFETAAHPLRRVGYERNGWDEKIEINGVNGRMEIYTVTWDQAEHRPALLIHYDNVTETTTEYPFFNIDPFETEMQYMYDCLVRREQGKPDVVDGFNVDVVIEGIMESSRKKMPIKLDWRGF